MNQRMASKKKKKSTKKTKKKKVKRTVKALGKRKKKARPGCHPNTVKHRFNSESARAAGRKGRGPRLTTYLRGLLVDAKKKGELTEMGELLMERVLMLAIAGDVTLMKEVLNRIDGKVPDRLETQKVQTFDHMSDEEIEQMINKKEPDAPESSD